MTSLTRNPGLTDTTTGRTSRNTRRITIRNHTTQASEPCPWLVSEGSREDCQIGSGRPNDYASGMSNRDVQRSNDIRSVPESSTPGNVDVIPDHGTIERAQGQDVNDEIMVEGAPAGSDSHVRARTGRSTRAANSLLSNQGLGPSRPSSGSGRSGGHEEMPRDTNGQRTTLRPDRVTDVATVRTPAKLPLSSRLGRKVIAKVIGVPDELPSAGMIMMMSSDRRTVRKWMSYRRSTTARISMLSQVCAIELGFHPPVNFDATSYILNIGISHQIHPVGFMRLPGRLEASKLQSDVEYLVVPQNECMGVNCVLSDADAKRLNL